VEGGGGVKKVPMHVSVNISGDVIIDNRSNVGDVESSRHDIGTNDNSYMTTFELAYEENIGLTRRRR